MAAPTSSHVTARQAAARAIELRVEYIPDCERQVAALLLLLSKPSGALLPARPIAEERRP
jgi:hypothetical protein